MSLKGYGQREKVIGNLIFDEQDYQIKHKATNEKLFRIEDLPYDRLAEKTIIIPVIKQIASRDESVAADAVGTPEFAHYRIYMPANLKRHLKEVHLIVDYTWAATADGTLQLYNVTKGVVVAETSTKVGGESSEWEAVAGDIAKVDDGDELVVRANITVAGAAGETVTLHGAFITLVFGVR